MRVGFYHAGISEPHERLAARLIASCRQAMPGVGIVQFTDDRTFPVVGVDATLRGPNGPVALRCLEAYESAGDGDWLFLDSDTEVKADVRSVFALSFDVAVAERRGTLLPKEEGTKFMARMPHNKGVVFSRCRKFWHDAALWLRGCDDAKHEWMGDQLALNAMIAAGDFDVSVLSSAYNYPPKSKTDDVSGKAILHFKGPRKQWALEGCFA